MGNFGSYEEALTLLKAEKELHQGEDLVGIDIAINIIQSALVDDIRTMESHYQFEAERDWKY